MKRLLLVASVLFVASLALLPSASACHEAPEPDLCGEHACEEVCEIDGVVPFAQCTTNRAFGEATYWGGYGVDVAVWTVETADEVVFGGC